MNSSRKSTGAGHSARREPILAGEGGLPAPVESTRDPIAAWMELMEVVEALCPRWPERPRGRRGTEFRL